MTIYSNLREPLPFTGGLLLARDFVEELYVHMGFQPAWKFRDVREVMFEDGKVRTTTDRSAALAEVHRRFRSGTMGRDVWTNVGEWIAQGYYHQGYRSTLGPWAY